VENKVFAPIIISKITSTEQRFKEFIVQMRQVGDKAASEVVAQGAKRGNVFQIKPVIFSETIKGLKYEYRVGVKSIDGVVISWSKWAQKTAGDQTPPPEVNSGNITLKKLGVGISALISGYTKTLDFKEFQWYWNSNTSVFKQLNTETIPLLTSPANHITINPEGVNSTRSLYVYVRACDQAGNVTSWTEKSIDLVAAASAGNVLVLSDAIVMG